MGNTSQRRAILAILSAKSGEHMTAEQVFDKARLKFPNIGKGTVYRNLNMLADDGVIMRVHIPGEPMHFDVNAAPHQHAVCVRCGDIIDISDLEREEIHRMVGSEGEIIGYSLVAQVVCNKCLGKE